MPTFCRQYVHCLKFTSRYFMYCLTILKKQKEVFQISFLLCNISSAWRDQMSSSNSVATQLRMLAGYKHVGVNYLHVVSQDYQEVIQHTYTRPHTHSVTESFYFFSLNIHLSFNTNSSGEWKFQILLNQKRKSQACHKQTKDGVWKHKGLKSQYG